MHRRRTQLSLYVPAGPAEALEAVRRLVDPVQSNLIPAHVTLCREDELGELSALSWRLGQLRAAPLTLRFGRPEVFFEHGLLLRCVEGEPAFRRLREEVLGSRDLGTLRPHLTLAHPRNPRAPGNSLAAAEGLPADLCITFPTLFLIEQVDGGPWQVRGRHPLTG